MCGRTSVWWGPSPGQTPGACDWVGEGFAPVNPLWPGGQEHLFVTNLNSAGDPQKDSRESDLRS